MQTDPSANHGNSLSGRGAGRGEHSAPASADGEKCCKKIPKHLKIKAEIEVRNTGTAEGACTRR